MLELPGGGDLEKCFARNNLLQLKVEKEHFVFFDRTARWSDCRPMIQQSLHGIEEQKSESGSRVELGKNQQIRKRGKNESGCSF